jgi:hypothetical protein
MPIATIKTYQTQAPDSTGISVEGCNITNGEKVTATLGLGMTNPPAEPDLPIQ